MKNTQRSPLLKGFFHKFVGVFYVVCFFKLNFFGGVPRLCYILCKHSLSCRFWTYFVVSKACQNLRKTSFFVALLCHQPGFVGIVQLWAKSAVAWGLILFDLFANGPRGRKKWIAVETE